MKKIITILLLLIIGTINAQDTISKNKSFEEILTPYVEKLLNGLEQGVEFAQQELPIILEQYLIYESIEYGLLLILSVLLIFLGFYCQRKWWDNMESPASIGGIGGFIIYVGGAIMFISNISSFIKVTFFPKLYLVEKFIHLIN